MSTENLSSVLIIRRDGSKTFVDGVVVAGVWDGELILSSDPDPVGMDVTVKRSVPLGQICSVEIVRRGEEDDAAAPDWGMTF